MPAEYTPDQPYGDLSPKTRSMAEAIAGAPTRDTTAQEESSGYRTIQCVIAPT